MCSSDLPKAATSGSGNHLRVAVRPLTENLEHSRWANDSKYEFFRLLRSRFGLRRGLRHFIKIIAVAFAPHQIALFNHFVHIGVKGGFANARVLFRVLLRQIKIIAVAIGGEIEIELKSIGR